MLVLTVLIIAISPSLVKPQDPACEQLIECYAKSRAKTEECLSYSEERECKDKSLKLELRALTEERISLYENCLREKSPSVTSITNAEKKAECNAIMQNSENRNKPMANRRSKNKKKYRRSVTKNKRRDTQQKRCFREERKLKSYCGQLSKCCIISKLCKTRTPIDEKIIAKRMEIKEAEEQCRMERYGIVKAKNRDRKRGDHDCNAPYSKKSRS